MKTPEQITQEILAPYMDRGIGIVAGAAAMLIEKAIEADRAQRTPYLLSFEPNAIRDHFEVDDDDPTAGMTDEQLLKVGRDALCDDRLYEAFHEALVDAIGERA